MEIRRCFLYLILAALVVLMFTGCPPSKPATDDNPDTAGQTDDNGTTDPNGTTDDPGITDETGTTETGEGAEPGETTETGEGGETQGTATPTAGGSKTSAYMAAYKGAGSEAVGSEKCMMCHSDKKPGEGKSHVTVFEGNASNPNYGKGCEACHGPGGNHNGDKAGIIQPQKMSQDEVITLCTQCHKSKGKFELAAYQASKHYAAGNSCVTCHSAHSTNAAFLVDAVPNNVCATCHTSQVEGLTNGSHGMANGVCKDCHNPHKNM